MWYNGAGGDFLTHLLVVDDEVSILELIKNSLGKDGYLITVCQNADDVDIKKLHFYDLILLDVMMPGTDGFEFCKQIRNMVDCPILFLTAKTLQTGYNLSSRNLIWDVRRIGLVVPHNGVNDGDHLPTGVANGRHVGLPFIPFFLKIKL